MDQYFGSLSEKYNVLDLLHTRNTKRNLKNKGLGIILISYKTGAGQIEHLIYKAL